jgi:hypothetical protein
MRQCDYCGNSNKVLFVAELSGFNPGVHLCEVCRSCYWNEEKGVDLEFSEGKIAPISHSTAPPAFFSGSVVQKLIPRLLD